MGVADVNAILPAGRASKPAARAFVAFLVDQLRAPYAWSHQPKAGSAAQSRKKAPPAAKAAGPRRGRRTSKT
jgi:hypothetical protein